MPAVLDADEPRQDSDDAAPLASHVDIFGRGSARDRRHRHLGRGLIDIAKQHQAFVAVTDGANDVLWLADGELRQVPAFKVDVVDTLGAGDTFHGAFTLMLAEGKSEREAMRFSAAAAALKCANALSGPASLGRAEPRRRSRRFSGRSART